MKTKKTDEDLLRVTRGFIDAAYQFDSEEFHDLRERAERYFDGKTPDGLRDRPNRSTYVDTVLRDTLLWLMPNLSRIFHATNDVVDIQPRGAHVGIQADVAHAWVNKVCTVQNKDFIEDTAAVQDALLFRLGWQYIDWDETVSPPRIKIQAVPPEDVLVSREATHDRLSWPFTGFKEKTNPARLRAEGYDVDDDIQGDEIDGFSHTIEHELREHTTDDLETLDPALKEVYKYRIWYPCYEDGDWHYVVRVGETILEHRKVPEHGMVYYTPILKSHRVDGLSISEIAFKQQDVNTALHRAVNDGMYRNSNPREEVVMGGVTPHTYADLINDQFDGRVRVRQAGTIVPIQPPQFPQVAMTLIDHYDERTSSRTGIQKYQQGLAPDTLNKTASGTAMIMDAGNTRIEQIARTLAETGFADRVGLILRLSLARPDLLSQHIVTVRGIPMPLAPELLPQVFDLVVNVGVGVGNRTERTTALQNFINNAIQLASSPAFGRLMPGGDLAIYHARGLYEAQAEMLRLAGYTNTQKFLVDPADPNAERDQPPKTVPTAEDRYIEIEADKQALAREKSQYDQYAKLSEMKLKNAKDLAEIEARQKEVDALHQKIQVDQQKSMQDLEAKAAEVQTKRDELDIKQGELDLRMAEVLLAFKVAGVEPPDYLGTGLPKDPDGPAAPKATDKPAAK
jgi:hypothetical protein